MTRLTRLILATVLLATVGLFAPAPSAIAVSYPGGKRIYTVSIGAIPAPGTSGGDVWVRLAMYYFFADGTVREGFFFWNRSTVVGATSTTITSAGCDGCAVRTATGFEPGNPGKTLNGTFAVSGSVLTVDWGSGVQETWNVSNPVADLARIDLVSSTYGARVGYGFGSNASNDSYVRVDQIPRQTYSGRHHSYNGGPAATGPSAIGLGGFAVCNINCLSLLSAPSTACSTCPNGASSSPIRYYLAGAGRRNFYEHWCRCLTPSTCYTGGSHRKPQLQVIGDTGIFHGWVGVEASNSVANTGYFSVHFHVDV